MILRFGGVQILSWHPPPLLLKARFRFGRGVLPRYGVYWFVSLCVCFRVFVRGYVFHKDYTWISVYVCVCVFV